MNESARRELDEAASFYWQRQPWKVLTDEDHFGLRDSRTGLVACAVVMGKAGVEIGLWLLVGAEAFEVSRRLRQSEMDQDEFGFGTEFLSLTYTPKAQVPKERRNTSIALSPVKTERGILIPIVWRKPRYGPPKKLTDEEAGFLARAARAIPDLLAAGRLSPLRLLDPSGMPVFLLPEAPGGPILEERAAASSSKPRDQASPPLNISAVVLSRLSGLKPRGKLAVSLAVVPASVEGQQARTLLALDLEADFMLLARAFGGPAVVDEASRYLLSAMVGEAETPSGKPVPLPENFITDSLELYNRLKDVLADRGVRVAYQEVVPPLDRAKESLSDFLRRRL